MSFNSTSNVKPHTILNTRMYGVILPQSSKVLTESDIDLKIKKTKNAIDQLTNAQAHRKTHGGKRFRGRQIELKNQKEAFTKTLALLTSAKEIVVHLNKKSKVRLENYIPSFLLPPQNFVQNSVTHLVNYMCSYKVQPVTSNVLIFGHQISVARPYYREGI